MATVREGNKSVLLVVDVQVNVVKGSWEAQRVVGNVALSVSMTAISNALAIVLMPLNFAF